MDQINKILIVIVLLALIISASVLVWKNSQFCYVENAVPPEEQIVQKEVIDTLNVTYWNPWGGPTATGVIHNDYPAFTLAEYVKGSDIIVSATVSSTTEWNDSSSAGKEKLKELGSPWLYSSNRECYLIVNDVLKGNYDINRVYLKTDVKTPELRSGQEYILFINGSVSGNYVLCTAEGYLIQNGSNYEGMYNISMPKEDLEYLISFTDKELDWYHRMAAFPQVFIGEMLTTTNDADLIHSGGLESKQLHQVRVISTVKGNLSDVVDFMYDGAYITEEMFQTYAASENMSPVLSKRYALTWLESNGTGYYQEHHWDPEISPLKAGEVYLICLWEDGGVYHMGASVTDYRMNEHNKLKLQKTVKEYQETLGKIEQYV
ncbi:MAG: hypothetical protein LBU81_04295 [Methanosarcinales archaeon]|jgi:hypothetical protein|nr:hypothetical protein [Methanosarcinales archaeon]